MTVYSEAEATLIASMNSTQWQTLNQIVRRSRLPRRKVIALLARFVRFELVALEFIDRKFVFRLLV